MKRPIAIALGLGATALIAFFGVSATRPDLLPNWARLLSASQTEAPGGAGLFCAEHGVPEAFCTLCHEDLKTKLLLCPEHNNIPEDICTLCHPEVEKKHNLKMCKEHALPESFCYQCDSTRGASTASPDDGWCAPHNTPETLCAICLSDPERHLNDSSKECRDPLPLVRLKTPKLAEQIGLETGLAVSDTHAHTLEATAETDFDMNRYADITPRVSGYLREVRADLGQVVKAGDVLAVVDSPQISAAKSRYISTQAALRLARADYERTRDLVANNAAASRMELEALTLFNQAESAELDAVQNLRNLGFSDQELSHVQQSKDTTSLLTIVSPIDGTVTQRHAVRGEAVEPATALFAVADTSTIWLWIDVHEADIERVKLGQNVQFTISGASTSPVEGKVSWISVQVDPTTRTTRLRAELANPHGRLRANQFGIAVVELGAPHEVVVVPRTAVQTKDDVQVVFLPQEEPGVYRPQRVVTQPAARRDMIEVAWGLKPGDRVVTKGSFWLKTEIMKGAIGAGCCLDPLEPPEPRRRADAHGPAGCARPERGGDPAPGRLPRHHARSGPDQHHRTRIDPGGGRAPDHLPRRACYGRAEGAGRTAIHLEIWSLPGCAHLFR
jgi:cobalt-zinc-cadmium efflux system membrane fusion protein